MKILLPFLFLPLGAKETSSTAAIISEAQDAEKIPAIAAVAFHLDKITEWAVSGHTQAGGKIPVAKDSTWHIGSDAKAMTATLAAVLVEKNLLTWETTMAEVFPNLAEKFHPSARKINVVQLLSHTAGLPANPLPVERLKTRLEVTQIGLAREPNQGFHYSNYGYIIAGAVVEKILGTTWEEAIQKHLFKPLGIKSVGFGAPTGATAIHGHRNGQPVNPCPFADNPPMYGPAGGLHLSLSDWVLFCQDQIKGHHGNGKLLKQATYQKLHTPVKNNYALGWGVRLKDGKTTLRHDGSNTMWYARAILDLDQKSGKLITLNTADQKVMEWISKIAGALGPRNSE